jgi:hypothetical protein
MCFICTESTICSAQTKTEDLFSDKTNSYYYCTAVILKETKTVKLLLTSVLKRRLVILH